MSTTTSIPVYSEAPPSFHQAIFRWDEAGKLSEAHTTVFVNALKDGKLFASKTEKRALVVGDPGNKNLEDLLGAMHVSNIATIQQLQADLASAQAETAKTKAAWDEDSKARDANAQKLLGELKAAQDRADAAEAKAKGLETDLATARAAKGNVLTDPETPSA